MTAEGSLPFIDEHAVEVAAGEDATWDAALDVADSITSGLAGRRGARLLGCADSEAGGPRPLGVGSTVPGFRVAAADAPRLLSLVGSHRFSAYSLTFRIDGLSPSRSRVRAETRAEFPGLHGRAYRALVIGTRGHVLATRRILGAIRRRAER